MLKYKRVRHVMCVISTATLTQSIHHDDVLLGCYLYKKPYTFVLASESCYVKKLCYDRSCLGTCNAGNISSEITAQLSAGGFISVPTTNWDLLGAAMLHTI